MKKRVGIWIRVSTDMQAHGDSPEHHEQRARMYAQVNEWEVIEVYHLEAVSGKSVMHHSEAKRMMHDIERGHISAIIFSKLARLARNTRELLDFADFFKQYKADLISLEEKIDTSSPAGRFFYTLLAAMAEWERAEISARVASSVKVRAKLGKPLGGQTPFGYKYEGKELVLDESEAPVRKLIHELFVKHKRKKRVAKVVNEMGYRTRNGSKFTGTTIDRFLRDSIVIGLRRVNYTKSTGEGKKWVEKPKEEWEYIETPRLISDELFEQGLNILEEMSKKRGKVRRKAKHLFSGILYCTCGTKMYMRSRSPKYVCKNSECRNKIEPDILEEVFQQQLENFLFSDEEIQKHIDEEYSKVNEKKVLLNNLKKDSRSLQQKIEQVFELYHNNQIQTHDFRSHHEPLRTELDQKEETILQLEAEIDQIQMNTLSNDQVLHDARNLHKRWNTFSQKEKKDIIDIVVSKIVVGEDTIDISLAYLPVSTSPPATQTEEVPSSLTGTTKPRTNRDSSTPPA